jgi:hypothetical protein
MFVYIRIVYETLFDSGSVHVFSLLYQARVSKYC